MPAGNKEIILFPQQMVVDPSHASNTILCKDAIHIRDFSTDHGRVFNLQSSQEKKAGGLPQNLDTTIYTNYLSSQDGLVDVALLVEDGDPALTLSRMARRPQT